MIPCTSDCPRKEQLLPARAGMIPIVFVSSLHSFTAPRTRGDDPVLRIQFLQAIFLLPARAGMIPLQLLPLPCDSAAPRTRGDDPMTFASGDKIYNCSPHARG